MKAFVGADPIPVQVLDQNTIKKLNEFRRATGTSYGKFKFEPGTGNWYFGEQQ